jgi:hypothetical protein
MFFEAEFWTQNGASFGPRFWQQISGVLSWFSAVLSCLNLLAKKLVLEFL